MSCDALAGGGRYPIYYMDEHVMPAGQHDLSFRLWINSDIDYLLLRFTTDKPAAELDIESILFKRKFRVTFMYLMLQLVAVMLVMDGAVIAYWNRKRWQGLLKKHIDILIGLSVILGISALPVFMGSLVVGHDVDFHLARIVGLAEGLSAGQMPVRIQPGWSNDYGYAVSVFYGDLLLYLPAVLYLFGVPLLFAYHIYLILIHLGTVGIAYYSYCRLCGDRYISLFCTALTSLSVNRILNVYTRSAVGEFSAYLFFPLVIVGMKEILCKEKTDSQESSKRNAWVLLGIGMAGILQTHILSFEMVCLFLGFVVLVLLKRMLCRERILTMLKAVILAIGLSAWFLLPFLDYAGQELEIFKGKYDYGIQGLGLHLYELFALPTISSGKPILSEEGLYGRYPAALGIGAALVVILGVLALVKFDWNKQERNYLLFVSGLAGTCIWMATLYFPWNRLAKIPGVRDVVFSFQFPWRYLSLAIPLMAYAAALVLVKIKACIPWNRTKYLLLFLCGITVLQGMYVTDLAVRNSRKGIYDGAELLREDRVLMGAEYLFVDTDRNRMQEETEVSGENVEIANQTRNGNAFSVTCRAAADAYLEFPLLSYRYYQCRDAQSDTEFRITQGTNYKIRVELPSDYQGTLQVFFEEPWYWRAAEGVSLLTVLALGGYGIGIIKIRKKSRKRQEGHSKTD